MSNHIFKTRITVQILCNQLYHHSYCIYIISPLIVLDLLCVLGGCVFHTQNGIRAGLALKIATDKRFRYLDGERDLVGERDEDGMTALQLLSCNPKAFEPVRRRGFLKRISSKGKYHKVNIMNTIFLLFSFSAHINGVIFFFIFLVKRFFFFF